MHSGFTEFNASNRVKRYEDLWSCWYWNMCPHYSRPIYHHWKNVSILRWDGIWRRFEVCNWRPRVLDYEADKFATEHPETKVNTIITIRRVWFPITLQYKESFWDAPEDLQM
jgi:hypothetical protein